MSTGNGVFFGGIGTATLDGGEASGSFFGDPGGVTIFGAAGGGMITAGGNHSIIVGSTGTDFISETLSGGSALATARTQQIIIGSTDLHAVDVINGSTVAFSGPHIGSQPSILEIVVNAGVTEIATGTEEQDVVLGGTGTFLTITGSASTLLALASSSASAHTTVNAGSGSTFVFGGPGALTATGGSGPMLLLGSGNGTANPSVAGIVVTGSSGPTFIFGSAGHDSVTAGGDGSEVQGGGLSSFLANGPRHNAILIAGIGADTFRVNAAPFQAVEIVGFRSGIDHLDLAAVGINASNLPSGAVISTSSGPALDIHLGNGQELLLVGVNSISAQDLL